MPLVSSLSMYLTLLQFILVSKEYWRLSQRSVLSLFLPQPSLPPGQPADVVYNPRGIIGSVTGGFEGEKPISQGCGEGFKLLQHLV